MAIGQNTRGSNIEVAAWPEDLCFTDVLHAGCEKQVLT